eukprot:2296025-Rhodomonas_salina.1
MRSLADLGGRSVGRAASARFQIMQHGRDYVVINAGKPEEFTSFDHLKIEAGGLGNLVDEALFRKALKMDKRDPIEAVHMSEYCCRCDKSAAPVTGFSRFRIRKRLYPWVSTGMTDELVVRNFQRLCRCIAVMENVWTRVGLWDEVLAPFPEAWTGGRPDV